VDHKTGQILQSRGARVTEGLKCKYLTGFSEQPLAPPLTQLKIACAICSCMIDLELPAGRLEILEEELIAVVGRYFELDKDTTKFDLQQFDRKAALIANFPLLRSKC
jgi:hypothetical protein